MESGSFRHHAAAQVEVAASSRVWTAAKCAQEQPCGCVPASQAGARRRELHRCRYAPGTKAIGRTVGSGGLLRKRIGAVGEGICAGGGPRPGAAEHPAPTSSSKGGGRQQNAHPRPRQAGWQRCSVYSEADALSDFWLAFILAADSFNFCLRASLLRGRDRRGGWRRAGPQLPHVRPNPSEMGR